MLENGFNKPMFRENFRNANICSRFFYLFADRLMLDVYRNNKKMKDDHIEDMTFNDEYDDLLLNKFEAQIEDKYRVWSD